MSALLWKTIEVSVSAPQFGDAMLQANRRDPRVVRCWTCNLPVLHYCA